MMMMMNVEQSAEGMAGETVALGENQAQYRFAHQNPT
jgi:hypothetical protein